MIQNRSPWIHQLKRTRPVVPLGRDLSTDLVIVGGGIAGVVTAFFILRDTDQSVVLLEADKIAHGATGHNAGQITSYFERSFYSMVDEFGLLHASEGQHAVESAWDLLEEICRMAELQVPYYTFMGYAGYSTFEQIEGHLKNNALRVQGGLPMETMLIADDYARIGDISPLYDALYTKVARARIMELLETKNPDYVAVKSYKKGCMNSALFSEQLINYLTIKYPDRFSFFEESPVTIITLEEQGHTSKVRDHLVKSKRTVLCTNGFDGFHIFNRTGHQIDPSFHAIVNGRIGYMTAYLEQKPLKPAANSYFPLLQETTGDPMGEAYFYLTRRPYGEDGESISGLVSAAGPDKVLPNRAVYDRKEEAPEDIQMAIDDFLQKNYREYPKDNPKYEFFWHGLMGYTPNRIRRIGPEPHHPSLMYNLGCNGVGILPSIYGGKKIAQFINGETLSSSIFDPHDTTQ